MKKILIILTIFAFSILTAIPFLEYGLIGFFERIINNTVNLQILVDLIIACFILIVWMFNDAKKLDISSTPYIVITLIAGSFGPLFYLLRREFILEKRNNIEKKTI